MRIETLIIGDELLDGRVTDTNSVRFARVLAEYGLRLSRRTTITDDIAIIVEEAQRIAQRGTELCLVSGGLGPTVDDLTFAAFAELCGVELVRDDGEATKIRERLERFGRPVTENQLQQADRPAGAEVIANPVGTAPGFGLHHQGCRFVSVPGVPAEFDAMVESSIIGPLRTKEREPKKRRLRSFGLIEAQVEERIGHVIERFPHVRVGFRAHFPEIELSFVASMEHAAQIEEAVSQARESLGAHIFSEKSGPFAEDIVLSLREADLTVATAESCTGGRVGDLITDVSGSSAVFREGVVVYSNDAKQERLGVRPETLVAHGAVSEQTVTEMAQGIRTRARADYGIALSGIAGPGGGTPDKPVGTVWVAVAGPAGVVTRKLNLPFGRRRNKDLSAHAALHMLRNQLRPTS
ncbi:MAG: CinA family nicotinamide mononucleotide deamidase-related protein [Myxococcota bacterium]|nr:CinA family nicotinamide mononucleotide deamidase-related protein [Myxococcota bacterium]